MPNQKIKGMNGPEDRNHQKCQFKTLKFFTFRPIYPHMMRNQSLLHLAVIMLTLCATTASGAESLTSSQATSPAHQTLDCRQCHSGSSARTGSTSPTVDDTRCRACHGKKLAAGADVLGFHAKAGGRSCLGCHSFHEPGTVTTNRGTLVLDSLQNLNTDHCLSCHDGKGPLTALNEAHLAAARLYHEQAASLAEISPSQACLNCHSNSAATSWQAAHGQDVLAFSEHATHPFEVEVVPGRGDFAHRIRKEIDPRIPLFEKRIQCQTCHQLTSDTEDLVVALPTTQDLCLGCHQFRDRPLVDKEEVMAAMVGR
jgi:predicted CXXCH cytochrome family protein